MSNFDVPAGWPVYRHVTAEESLRHWGACEVFDAHGTQIKDVFSCCVSSGEVFAAQLNTDGLYVSTEGGFASEIKTIHPAPLIVRKRQW